MKTITNKQYAEYQQFLKDKRNGRVLTPLGLKTICQANDYVPEKIGQHMLEVLAAISDSIPSGETESTPVTGLNAEKITLEELLKHFEGEEVWCDLCVPWGRHCGYIKDIKAVLNEPRENSLMTKRVLSWKIEENGTLSIDM